MRLNTECNIGRRVAVYLNDVREPNAVEVYVPGNSLEGDGYVVRLMTKITNGRPIPSFEAPVVLLPYQYAVSQSYMCEKIFGRIRIEIAECPSQFED